MMAKEAFASLLLCVIFIQRTWAEGHIEIRFKQYKSGCGDCDPMFKFCVDRPSSEKSVDNSKCSYGTAGESGHYHNTGTVNFGSDIKGIANPWKVRFGRLHEKSIMLVARTRDDDIFGADHMQTWGQVYTERVYPTESEAKYVERKMRQGSHELIFDIKIYCIEDFYGWDCSRKCIPQDSSSGHYICNRTTGEKICLKGWTGSKCSEDIDECALNFCQNGKCQNEKGDYKCICPDHYSGRNCSILGDPCESQPCLNNGTCTAVEDEYNYTCSCEEPWTGHDCEVRRSPCEDEPCFNAGECISNANNTNFTCECRQPFTGPLCLERKEPPKNPLPPKDPQRVSGKDSSEGFLYWHGLLIGLVFLIVIIAIILFFIFRRRRKEKKHIADGLPPGNSVHFNGGNLAFENNMYNSRSRENSHNHTNGAIRQHPPLPTTPTDDDSFNPVKLNGYCDINEIQGATGGYEAEEGGYMKPSSIEKELKNQETEPSENQRAQDNQYSDFNAMTNRQPEHAEPHYQDLDEVAQAFQGLDDETRDDVNLVGVDMDAEHAGHSPRTTAKLKAMAGLPLEFAPNPKEHPYSEPTMSASSVPAPNPKEHQYSQPTMSASSLPGNFGLSAPTMSESPYTEVPSNAPALGISGGPPLVLGTDSGAYSPIEDESEFDFALAQRVSSRRQPAGSTNENPYAEPAVPPRPTPESLSSDAPTFNHQPYAEVFPTPISRTASNRLAEDDMHDDDDDDFPNVGLPHVDAGYAFPPRSFDKNPREPVYADPKEPENLNVNEYASPRSSGDPPDVPPKPQVDITGRSQSTNYEDVQPGFNDLPPVPSLPLPPPPEQDNYSTGSDETPDTDISTSPKPLPSSVHEQMTEDTNVHDDDGVSTSTKRPALFLENHVFSMEDEI